MAKFVEQPRIELTVRMVLGEEEARALDALSGYGVDAFVKHFYEHLGEHYMKPHEAGLRSFLESCRGISGILKRTDDARSVFTGEMRATHRKKDEE